MMMTVAKNDYNIVVAALTTTKDCLLIPLCPKSKKKMVPEFWSFFLEVDSGHKNMMMIMVLILFTFHFSCSIILCCSWQTK